MKVRRNAYTFGAGEVRVEAAKENVIILEVESTYPSARNTAMRNAWHEGGELHLDGAIGSVRFEGTVTITAALAMSDKEARALISELQQAVDS